MDSCFNLFGSRPHGVAAESRTTDNRLVERLSSKSDAHGDGGCSTIMTKFLRHMALRYSKKDIFGRVINIRPAIIMVNSRHEKLKPPLPHFNDEKNDAFWF